MSEEGQKKAEGLKPGIIWAECPPGVYRNQDQGAIGPALVYYIGARRDVPEDVIYNIVKAIFDEREYIGQRMAAAKMFNEKVALAGIDKKGYFHSGEEKWRIHTGALKFLKNAIYWNRKEMLIM